MSRCTGSPAELSALPYVEGVLPDDEAERFEEHYFDCPVCLEHLQTLQAMRAGMAKLSAEPAQAPSRKNMLSWPRMTWAIGSIGSIAAALLLIGFVYQSMSRSHGEPAVAAKCTCTCHDASRFSELCRRFSREDSNAG